MRFHRTTTLTLSLFIVLFFNGCKNKTTSTVQNSVEVNGSMLTAKKDGNVTVQAWVVNGHVLPPEPDPTVNNATLLGVDVNDNGVRDDVERAIYKKFPKEIRRKQLMQQAKSDQSMMADDEAIKNAQKWQKIIANKNIACEKYLFRKFDIDFNLEAYDYMDNIQYNTKDRVIKYMRYNHALGGGVYFTPESIVNESSCEFNVTKALKAQ